MRRGWFSWNVTKRNLKKPGCEPGLTPNIKFQRTVEFPLCPASLCLPWSTQQPALWAGNLYHISFEASLPDFLLSVHPKPQSARPELVHDGVHRRVHANICELSAELSFGSSQCCARQHRLPSIRPGRRSHVRTLCDRGMALASLVFVLL